MEVRQYKEWVWWLMAVLPTFSHANLNVLQKSLILSDINIQLSEYIYMTMLKVTQYNVYSLLISIRV